MKKLVQLSKVKTLLKARVHKNLKMARQIDFTTLRVDHSSNDSKNGTMYVAWIDCTLFLIHSTSSKGKVDCKKVESSKL